MTKETVAPIPPDVLKGTKDEVGHYLLEIVDFEIGPPVYSELLPRQLDNCVAGIRNGVRQMERAAANEFVQRYEQLRDEEAAAVDAMVEDHVLMFVIAAQLYVGRIVEAVRGFKLHEADHYKLPTTYEDKKAIRGLGKKVVGQMSIADCMWHLGNYAKHRDELRPLEKPTLDGLIELKAAIAQGAYVDALYKAIATIVGKTVDAPSDLEAALREIRAIPQDVGRRPPRAHRRGPRRLSL